MGRAWASLTFVVGTVDSPSVYQIQRIIITVYRKVKKACKYDSNGYKQRVYTTKRGKTCKTKTKTNYWLKGVRYETSDNYSMETSNNLKQLGTFYLEMGSLHFVTYLNLSISIWHGRKYYGMFMWFEIPKTFSTENNMIQIIELL